MRKKIAIIGCGIAGLTAANLFKTNPNFEVMIYEKEKNLSLQEGYGIQLAQNSISILNKIGFSDIDNNSFFNPSKLNFYSINNDKICDLRLDTFNTKKSQYTTIKRSILIEFLKKGLFEKNLSFKKQVKTVSNIKEKLLVRFTDNTNDIVDYIIVSDGIFSSTKSVIEKKKINPIYNGSIAIRALAKYRKEFNFDKNNISLIMLKNAHIVIYPINKNNELNLVCILRQKSPFKYDVRSLIKKNIFSQNKSLEMLFDVDLESWPIYTTNKPSKSIYKNLFYLGDAFYTFLPTMAQGASQSIEAAYELFNLLSQNTEEVQNIYFKKRSEKIKIINSRSKLNYYSFHLSNPLLVKARNIILKKITKNNKLLNSYLRNIYQEI